MRRTTGLSMTKAASSDRHTLYGPRVVLRAPQQSDKLDRLARGSHPEYYRMLGIDRPSTAAVTGEAVEQWYERVERNPLHWMVEVEKRCVGTAQLHHLDEHSRRARYAIALFDGSAWNRGIGTEVTRLVLWYAFETLRLHRVDLRVLDSNRRALRLYEKCGFVHEGRERDSVLVGDQWQDDILMGILEDEYRAAAAGWPEVLTFHMAGSHAAHRE